MAEPWDVKDDEIMMFVDATKCIGCRACQVACKQWHTLPAETTVFEGEYTNPPDYSGSTFTYVKFTEFERRNRVNFLFFKNQCRHCVRPKCQVACPNGVERTREGFVIFNEDCTPENLREDIEAACPFNVPKFNGTKYVKCDFCIDRFGGYYTTYRDGKPTTACELTCPPGAIVTGTAADITKLVTDRFAEVRRDNPYASIYSGNYGRTHVIYLLAEKASSYGLEAPEAP
jgi:formate dehydrogenase iron-sulfur subunit